MITKWIGIPYGIIVIVMAGYALSVVPEYLSSYSIWYSSYEHYSMLESALIFGLYVGIFTGLLVDSINHRLSFILAAILGLASYCLIPQFDGSYRESTNTQFYILSTVVFWVGQSASIAIIATIKVNLENFSLTTAPIFLSILLSYLYVTEQIEGSLRWSFFFGIDIRLYMYGVAATTFVIYIVAAIVMTVDESQQNRGGVSEFQLATLDKIGLNVFVVFEIFMILLLILFYMVIKDLSISTWIWVILLAGNFLIPIINSELILSRASELLSGVNPDMRDLSRLQKVREQPIFEKHKLIKLILLFLIGVIMLGSGSLVYEKLTKISIAINMSFLAEYAMIWYIFGNFVTRLLIGTTFIMVNHVNDFIFLIFFGIEILTTIVLVLLMPNQSVIIFNIACFLGGSGVGGIWIMLPVIITQEYGKAHYGFIWGIFTTGSQFGIWLFDYFYYAYQAEKIDRCSHPEWFKSSFIIAGILSLIGLGLIILLWFINNTDEVIKK